MVVGTVVAAPTVARADSIDHYYIEIGGTTGAADQPECTTNYRAANHKLQSGSGGTPAGPRVGIPAS
ncbi:hypothetical protein [Streptomyces sp. YGL11-2]|uniref:hypothetical protein n=1 Tax=Streptomyces sp. YGL11-2 TaxID=3414028 RepID=UPI003CF6C499